MKEWFNNNVSGWGIIASIIVLTALLGIGGLLYKEHNKEREFALNGLIKVEGYMKVSDLKYIVIEE